MIKINKKLTSILFGLLFFALILSAYHVGLSDVLK